MTRPEASWLWFTTALSRRFRSSISAKSLLIPRSSTTRGRRCRREETRMAVKLKSTDPVKRYLGIDVTKALDTVAWGHLWNAIFGWQNLLWELDKDPKYTTNQKRIDKAHPTMPVQRLARSHGTDTYADTVLMPEGVD